MQEIRSHFPSLARTVDGHQAIYLDGPAGTQVPSMVMDAMTSYYQKSNANKHGWFVTSSETDQIIAGVRNKCATFLNAESAGCISFGQNMTSLAFKLSRALSRYLEPGDEVVITQLDHEANRGPWLYLEGHGIVVREIEMLPNGTLDYAGARDVINSKTKLVAAGWSSNIFGTVNDLKLIRELTHAVGAWLLVDAVHYAPHLSIDVQDLECDFLLCSGYKFYGPHVGILYSKPGLLAQLDTDRLRTATQSAPERIETGTLNHAALAGVGASLDFYTHFGNGDSYREQLVSAIKDIGQHEYQLAKVLWEGLISIHGVSTYGEPFDGSPRCPTVAFTIAGKKPSDLCKFLGLHGVFAWDGHFYAIRATEVLDLLENGGVTRMGMAGYNTRQEIDRTLELVKQFAES